MFAFPSYWKLKLGSLLKLEGNGKNYHDSYCLNDMAGVGVDPKGEDSVLRSKEECGFVEWNGVAVE